MSSTTQNYEDYLLELSWAGDPYGGACGSEAGKVSVPLCFIPV